MNDEIDPHVPPAAAPVPPQPGGKPIGRVMLCVTEDWFTLSHFKPLIGVLVELARDVLVVTRSSGRLAVIEALVRSELSGWL